MKHKHRYKLDYSLVGFRMLCKCGHYYHPVKIKDWERYYFKEQKKQNKILSKLMNVLFKDSAVIKDFEVYAENKVGVIKTKKESVGIFGKLNLIQGKLIAKGLEIDGG